MIQIKSIIISIAAILLMSSIVTPNIANPLTDINSAKNMSISDQRDEPVIPTPITPININNIKDISFDDEQEAINYTEWDINGDNLINIEDFNFMINYLFINLTPAPNPIDRADFNHNGYVDMGDLTILIDHFVEIGILVPDQTKPVITLLNPDDEDVFKTSNDEKNIRFEFKVKDDSSISSCDLIINNDVYKTMNNVGKDIVISVSVELDRDDYSWKVSCVDFYGNKGYSETRDFEIKEKETAVNNDNPVTTSKIEKPNETPNTIYQNLGAINLEKQEAKKTYSFDLIWVAFILLISLVILLIALIFVIYSRR